MWRVDFADAENSSAYVSLDTARFLVMRGDTWRTWDFFWMLHNMDYINRKSFNHPLIIFVAFGFSFELPVAMVIAAALGWVTPAQLRESRGYAIVGVFIIAAVITPPDVVSQLMLAIPMCLLYEVGIIASGAVMRGRKADTGTD